MKQLKYFWQKYWYLLLFVSVNLLGIFIVIGRERRYIDTRLHSHAEKSWTELEAVMDNYTHSFQHFSHMLSREIENNPDPDKIWDYLKSIHPLMLDIEGKTFDGLYMYYQSRYLYSWDTPYSQYEDTGYLATDRPWYKDALAGKGEIVFTPPYMSYANQYILSTISQLQPDGETVFAYDIKMEDIQNLVADLKIYDGEQLLISDREGTVIGSTERSYLGGNLRATLAEAAETLESAQDALDIAGEASSTQLDKLDEAYQSASSFYTFLEDSYQGLQTVFSKDRQTSNIKIGSTRHYGYLMHHPNYDVLLLVPVTSMLKSTLECWLLPLLVLNLLLIYAISRISKELKNRELRAAYIELGQTQKRLELALAAAQKAAAIDDLTGMMNFKSFRRNVTDLLESMGPEESGILIMIDGDHFKAVNDQYGHTTGDEVIKLSAQMIIGRIRTIDLASRLHGDEFAIFVSQTDDYTVGRKIMADINETLAKEARKRNMPAISLSAGAVIARHGDHYAALAKEADAALYRAKETHNGQFESQ